MKKTPLYLFGIIFVLIGIIPVAKNVISTDLLEGNPFFFVLGGIWSILLVVIFYSFRGYKDNKLAKSIHDS